MATVVRKMDAEALKCMKGLAESAFLDGECYAFAIALSRGLGWPMVGLMQDTTPRHAAVYGLNHKLFDVRGVFRQGSPRFGKPFGCIPPYTLKPVVEEDLCAVRPVPEQTIVFARRMAEAVFPWLPWLNSEEIRVRAFIDDLEKLSRKHKLWIRGMAPAMRPLLARGEDDEGGYELQRTDDGMAFMIDRYLL